MRPATDASKAGFTLVEVLVVVVVLGIVTAIAIVSLAGALDRSKQRATMADMRIISRAIEAYIVDNHQPPDPSGGLAALKPVLVPYQSNVLPVRDHWNHPIAYEASDRDYTLSSYGRDGVNGSDVSVANRFDYDLDIVLQNGTFIASPE